MTSIKKLEKELARLRVSTTDRRPEGLSVYADPELPKGWVRVDSNGNCPIFGLAEALAENLRKVKPEEVSEDWAEVWDALGEVGEDKAPTNSTNWPSDLIKIEQLEDGSCNDQPNSLITVKTNAGTRYASGPHGVFACALGDWIENIGDLATTRKEAISKGCE